MISLPDLIAQGSGNLWVFVPSAIVLGILHGLEPGHSKTMMAAFIIAVRGTVGQAALLGLSATLSHTAVVWLVALGGLYLGRNMNTETSEPYFQIASALLIFIIAGWMIWRTWREGRTMKIEGHDRDPHHHHHDHAHDEIRHIDTGHGVLRLEIFEQGQPPRWRLAVESGHGWAASSITLKTRRPDGREQSFAFIDKGGTLESTEDIPEPHDFTARLSLAHDGHSHDYDVEFAEHGHVHDPLQNLDAVVDGYQDAHERAHANDIERRFTGREVTTGQIVLFGLTGGLVPCPAAITVLLLCLQLKRLTLGATLVICFSIGLAITMVSAGTIAALSVRYASKRWSGFGDLARRAPYVSGLLIIGIGIYIGLGGILALSRGG